jgi:hypothetical protein
MMKKTVGSGQADGLSVELPVLLRPVPLDRKGNAGKGDSVPRPIASYCRATIETDAPGANDAATISRFSASGQRLRRRPVAVVPITAFVDTFRPPNAKDHITVGEIIRFRKAVLGGG